MGQLIGLWSPLADRISLNHRRYTPRKELVVPSSPLRAEDGRKVQRMFHATIKDKEWRKEYRSDKDRSERYLPVCSILSKRYNLYNRGFMVDEWPIMVDCLVTCFRVIWIGNCLVTELTLVYWDTDGCDNLISKWRLWMSWVDNNYWRSVNCSREMNIQLNNKELILLKIESKFYDNEVCK